MIMSGYAGDGPAHLVLGVALLAAGGLLIWLAGATAHGRVGRNRWTGIRTRATLRSDAAWLAAHRRALWPTRLGGVCSLAGGLEALLPLSEGAFSGAVLAAAAGMVVCVSYAGVVGVRAARSAD